MKIKILSLAIFFIGLTGIAQTNIDQLMAGGLEDAEQFTKNYVAPASDALISNLSSGWFNTAKGKNFGKFEISIMGNGTLIDNGPKTFNLNTADYNYLHFQDPNVHQMDVATALGKNDPDLNMVIDYEDQNGNMAELEVPLPQGIGKVGVNILPSAYLQASVGILRGTEVKLRYVPKVEMEGVKTALYGVGFQHEITSWLAKNPLLHLSILAGYTKFDGSYNLEDNAIVMGNTKKLTTSIDSYVLSGIVSTNLPIINFYGALSYYGGQTSTGLEGDFHINEGVLGSQTITDPFSFTQKSDGVKGTLGVILKLSFFRLHADYSFENYNNLSVGISFGN